MVAHWDCFDGLTGMMRTATMTLLGICFYIMILGAFIVKGIGSPGRGIILSLLSMDSLALIFMGVFFCNQNKTNSLINAVAYVLTFIVELSLVLGWGVWMAMNKDKEDIEGCVICGNATLYAKFFFAAPASIWAVINMPLKIASTRNCFNYYNTKYSNTTTNYSLGMSRVQESEKHTLIIIE